MDPKQHDKNGNSKQKRQHVAILPLLNAGHLPPLVQLLYVLDSRCPGLIVTITASPKFAAELAEYQRRGALLKIDLRVEAVPGIIPRDAKTYRAFGYDFSDQNFLESEGLRERLVALKGTSEAPTSLIGDMFFYWCKDLADPGSSRFIFFSCYPVYTLLTLQQPLLMEAQLGERALTNPGDLLGVAAPAFRNCPGAAVLHLADLPYEEYFESSDFYVKIAKNLRHAAGILQNAAEEMDEPGGAINAIKEILGEDRVFAIGPALQEMVLEVAAALEATGVPFIWAVKLLPGSALGLPDLLPKGFLKRTAGQGMVLTGWLPQIKILQHAAVGAFLTHCGFNSTLETVCAGVPMIGWPMGADQLIIVRYVTQLTKNGISVVSFKTQDQYSFDNITRKEIEMAIKTVLLEKEGLELRANAQKLQKVVTETVQKGGSSYQNLERLLDLLSS